MKKLAGIIGLIVGIVFCYYSAEAQVSFGVKGGISISNINFEPEVKGPEIKSLVQPTGGVFAHVEFPILTFSIQPELLYVIKGQERTYVQTYFDPLTAEQTTKLQYLELPILLKFKIPVPAPVTPNVFVGPSIALLIGSESRTIVIKTKDGQTTKKEGQNINPIPNVKKSDFGIVFGAGLDFNLFLSKLTIDGRYNLGLSDIGTNGKDIATNTGENFITKNRAWMVMLGIAF